MQNPRNASAGFFVRWIAYLIDSLFVSLVTAMCLLPVTLASLFDESSIWNKQVLFHFTTYAVVVYVIRAVYFVITTYAMGATFGKKLLRLQVEAKDGKKLTFVNVLFRETVGRFLSGILYVGYLLALGREHLALHDMLCDTRVCYKNLAEIVRVHVVPMQNAAPQTPQNGNYVPPQSAPVPSQNGGYVSPQNGSYVPPQNSNYMPPQNAAQTIPQLCPDPPMQGVGSYRTPENDASVMQTQQGEQDPLTQEMVQAAPEEADMSKPEEQTAVSTAETVPQPKVDAAESAPQVTTDPAQPVVQDEDAGGAA